MTSLGAGIGHTILDRTCTGPCSDTGHLIGAPIRCCRFLGKSRTAVVATGYRTSRVGLVSPSGERREAAGVPEDSTRHTASLNAVCALGSVNPVRAVVVDDNGSFLVWASPGGFEECRRVSPDPLLCLVVSTDEAWVASAGVDGRLYRVSLATGLPVEGVSSLAFTQDGQWLAAGSSRGSLRMWRWSDRRLVYSSCGTNGEIKGLAFGAFESTLIAAHEDGTFHVSELDWELDVSDAGQQAHREIAESVRAARPPAARGRPHPGEAGTIDRLLGRLHELIFGTRM